MKKYLGIMVMVMSLAFLMPRVYADTSINRSCGKPDDNGIITCKITAKFDQSKDSITVSLTEQGGATITEGSIKATGQDWTIDTGYPTNSNGVYTIKMSSPGATESDLFQFSYRASGEENCKVILKLDEVTEEITPKKETTPVNPKTGSSLPYIALASITVLAGGAYVATKNKSKMYKL